MKTLKSVSPVKLSIYPKRTHQENRLIRKHPFIDSDKDGVANFFDCRPLDKKKQDFAAANPGGGNILTGVKNMEMEQQPQRRLNGPRIPQP